MERPIEKLPNKRAMVSPTKTPIAAISALTTAIIPALNVLKPVDASLMKPLRYIPEKASVDKASTITIRK